MDFKGPGEGSRAPGTAQLFQWQGPGAERMVSIWLLAGALTCRQYFHEDREIADLATLLYGRYDFPWMTNGNGKLLSHGWRPEGFITFRYDKYCQLAAMYLLGIGSPTHALPPDAWYAWERTSNSFATYNYIGNSLLWTYQYPFSWFDFRGRRESCGTKVDWFDNCKTATRAHREWCYKDLSKEFPGYTRPSGGLQARPVLTVIRHGAALQCIRKWTGAWCRARPEAH
jgi:hypothetical protein